MKNSNLRLLIKPNVTMREAVKARTGYNRVKLAIIEIDNEYFVLQKGKVMALNLMHRDLKKSSDSDSAK